MDTMQIAEELVELCRQGKFAEAGERFWADDVLSIEPFEGEMAHLRGKAAAAGKGAWWAGAHDVHGVEVDAPYVNGDQFLVRFRMDITVKESGQRQVLDEVGAYTVSEGKITQERFFVTKAYFERG